MRLALIALLVALAGLVHAQGIYFAGGSGTNNVYISTNTPNIFMPTNGFAVSAWIFPETGASGTIRTVFSDYTYSGGEYGFIIFQHPDMRLRLYIQPGEIFSTTRLPENQWTHIAVVRYNGAHPFDPSENHIYINGKYETTSGGVAWSKWPSGGVGLFLLIGATADYFAGLSYGSTQYKGYIADLCIWSNSLEAAQMAQLASGKRENLPQMWAHYAGLTAADRVNVPSQTRVVDLTGQHHAFTSNTVAGGATPVTRKAGDIY